MSSILRLRPAAAVVPAAQLGTWAEAADALQQARTVAAHLLESARARAEQITSQAEVAAAEERERGHTAGIAEGMEAMAAQIIETVASATRHVAELEEALPALVTQAVRNILGEFDDAEVLRRAVAHALTRTRRASSATLRLPADGVEALRGAVEALGGLAQGLFVEADNTLPPGACVLSSAYGVAELGVDAQLRVFEAQLTAALRTAA